MSWATSRYANEWRTLSHQQGVTVCKQPSQSKIWFIHIQVCMFVLIRQSNPSRRLRVWLSIFGSEYLLGLTRRYVLYCVLHSGNALCRVARAYVVLIRIQSHKCYNQKYPMLECILPSFMLNREAFQTYLLWRAAGREIWLMYIYMWRQSRSFLPRPCLAVCWLSIVYARYKWLIYHNRNPELPYLELYIPSSSHENCRMSSDTQCPRQRCLSEPSLALLTQLLKSLELRRDDRLISQRTILHW